MSKKHFIALADMIRNARPGTFSEDAINEIVSFCRRQNWDFMEDRFRDCIAGKCSANGKYPKVAA